MREVYTAKDEEDARRVFEQLQREGIDVVIRGEPLNILGLLVPAGQVYPSVCVRRGEDEEKARAIVEQIERRDRERAAQVWCCPGCGEEVGGQFAECWQCGEPAPPD